MTQYEIQLENLTLTMEYDESQGLGPSIGLNLIDPGSPKVFCPGHLVKVFENARGPLNPRGFGVPWDKPSHTVSAVRKKFDPAGDTGLVQTEMPT